MLSLCLSFDDFSFLCQLNRPNCVMGCKMKFHDPSPNPFCCSKDQHSAHSIYRFHSSTFFFSLKPSKLFFLQTRPIHLPHQIARIPGSSVSKHLSKKNEKNEKPKGSQVSARARLVDLTSDPGFFLNSLDSLCNHCR